MNENDSENNVASNVEPASQVPNQDVVAQPVQQPVTESSGGKSSGWKKALMIIGGIAVGVILIVVIIFVAVSINSKKLECTSSQGNITIMYSDTTINGYFANGISYDLDGQKAIAESIGVKTYLEEFDDWFRSNTDGFCIEK